MKEDPTEPTLDEGFKLRQAEDAKRLLADPLLLQAFGKLQETYTHLAIYDADDAKRVEARTLVILVDRIRDELKHVLTNGKMAGKEVELRKYQYDKTHEELIQ